MVSSENLTDLNKNYNKSTELPRRNELTVEQRDKKNGAQFKF